MKDMDQKIVDLLNQLIKFRANDLQIDIENGRATEKTKHHITELIIELTSYLHDIRYCSKSDCLCSPEYKIKYHYESVRSYLQETTYALHSIPWQKVEEILKGSKGN